MLSDSQGFPASVCLGRGIDAARLSDLLIACTPATSPKSFDLTFDACQRVILPTLARAGEYRRKWRLDSIDVRTLFKAYCEVASDDFVETLRTRELPSGLRVDLRAIGAEITAPPPREVDAGNGSPSGKHTGKFPTSQPTTTTPGGKAVPTGAAPSLLDHIPIPTNGVARKLFPEPGIAEAVRQIMTAAAHIAALQGYQEIRSPHLFAAFISYGSAEFRGWLERGPMPREQLLLNVLSVVASCARDPNAKLQVRLGDKVRSVLDAARVAASRRSASLVDERDVLRALLDDPQGIVPRVIGLLGYEALMREFLDGE